MHLARGETRKQKTSAFPVKGKPDPRNFESQISVSLAPRNGFLREEERPLATAAIIPHREPYESHLSPETLAKVYTGSAASAVDRSRR